MIIGHLTSAHPVHDVRIYIKQCRTLQKAGYQVVLIAPGSNTHQQGSGIQIISVRKWRNRLVRMIATTWEVFLRAISSKAKVLHFHDPELIPVGLVLKLCGRRVIYDVHENLPDQVMSKPWIPRVLRRSISKAVNVIELVSVRAFDAVVAATPKIASRFPERKTVVVQNFPILSEFSRRIKGQSNIRHCTLVYVGGIAEARGIIEMIAATEIARHMGLDVRLVIAGEFLSEELMRRVMAMNGWKFVDYLGWQSREQIAMVLSESLAGMVVLHPTLSYVDAYPVKLFEYMAAGIPVIASDFPLWREIIQDAHCGLLVNPLDPQAIANAILWLSENEQEVKRMGEAGALAVESRFSWANESAKLIDLYSRFAVS
ncbi:hypothetical protein ACG33_04795 [Steroidobacter denitrificans]|uniref:Glycosyl transferase n=1 Tax=Steroidobacter denitrificans TaxID=465721 RepID=A0A127F9X1_STEDE|nr:glycosyltransferase family 4 protein [Steroidobacter denitrificans]AMN46431.1 hypothetical protein ACG33_04795 [Steroidobacter denitrificans]